jgi:hypothetical protein
MIQFLKRCGTIAVRTLGCAGRGVISSNARSVWLRTKIAWLAGTFQFTTAIAQYESTVR